MFRLLKVIAFLLPFATSLHAETIYKSVDANGRVTYSSTPPENIEDASQVKIAPPPTESQKQAAQEQHEQRLKTADMLDENRKTRNELTAEENRLKRERQKQQEKQSEESTDDQYYGYPYYRRRVPAIRRPVQLPAGPAR